MLCREVIDLVGVTSVLYYDARKHKIKISWWCQIADFVINSVEIEILLPMLVIMKWGLTVFRRS